MFRQNTEYHDIFHGKYFVERTLGSNAVRLFIRIETLMWDTRIFLKKKIRISFD
jgi:hypothetical protein